MHSSDLVPSKTPSIRQRVGWIEILIKKSKMFCKNYDCLEATGCLDEKIHPLNVIWSSWLKDSSFGSKHLTDSTWPTCELKFTHWRRSSSSLVSELMVFLFGCRLFVTYPAIAQKSGTKNISFNIANILHTNVPDIYEQFAYCFRLWFSSCGQEVSISINSRTINQVINIERCRRWK